MSKYLQHKVAREPVERGGGKASMRRAPRLSAGRFPVVVVLPPYRERVAAKAKAEVERAESERRAIAAAAIAAGALAANAELSRLERD